MESMGKGVIEDMVRKERECASSYRGALRIVERGESYGAAAEG